MVTLYEHQTMIYRLGEMVSATPFPWGRYIRPIYESQMDCVASHLAHVGRILGINARLAMFNLESPDVDLDGLERVVNHHIHDIQLAQRRVIAARDGQLAEVLEPGALAIPATPTAAPHLRGGMHHGEEDQLAHDCDDLVALFYQPQAEREQTFFTVIHGIFDEFRQILMRVHILLNDLELAAERYAQARFFKVPYQRQAQTVMGCLRDEAGHLRAQGALLRRIDIPWSTEVARAYRHAFNWAADSLAHTTANIEDIVSRALLTLEQEDIDFDSLLLECSTFEDDIRVARSAIQTAYDLRFEEEDRMQAFRLNLLAPHGLSGGGRQCSPTQSFRWHGGTFTEHADTRSSSST